MTNEFDDEKAIQAKLEEGRRIFGYTLEDWQRRLGDLIEKVNQEQAAKVKDQ